MNSGRTSSCGPEGDWAEIALSKGQVAIVDWEDFDLLAPFTWFAWSATKESAFYAVRAGAHGYPVLRMHRLIMDAAPGRLVDHINGNTLDNRRINLRLCDRLSNRRNSRTNGGISRFKGVSRLRDRHRWRATITTSERRIFLGSFENEEDAARAYDAAAITYFGDFARLNFPHAGSGGTCATRL